MSKGGFQDPSASEPSLVLGFEAGVGRLEDLWGIAVSTAFRFWGWEPFKIPLEDETQKNPPYLPWLAHPLPSLHPHPLQVQRTVLEEGF